jgi:hypothetical protein
MALRASRRRNNGCSTLLFVGFDHTGFTEGANVVVLVEASDWKSRADCVSAMLSSDWVFPFRCEEVEGRRSDFQQSFGIPREAD